MRLSLCTDYALRTLIYLAGRPGRAQVADVARFFGISKDHVAKAVQQLARHRFVRSIRGVGGGIELARAAEQIRLGDVIVALEGNLNLLECVSTDNICVIQPGCHLRSVLARAERLQLEYLQSVRLSDLVVPGGQLVELVPSVARAAPQRESETAPRTAAKTKPSSSGRQATRPTPPRARRAHSD